MYPRYKRTNNKQGMALYESFILDILKYVAKDYSLNYKELSMRYTSVFEPISLSKMKKSDLISECIHHGVNSEGSVIELKARIKKSRSDSGIKTTRGNKKKVVKKVAPVHNHPLCEQFFAKCPLCQSHGNVFNKDDVEYEIVIA
jgi:hypothetical protein